MLGSSDPSRIFVVPRCVIMFNQTSPGGKFLAAVNAYKIHVKDPLFFSFPDDGSLGDQGRGSLAQSKTTWLGYVIKDFLELR